MSYCITSEPFANLGGVHSIVIEVAVVLNIDAAPGFDGGASESINQSINDIHDKLLGYLEYETQWG